MVIILMILNQDKFQVLIEKFNWKDKILIKESKDSSFREYEDRSRLGFVCKVNAWVIMHL